MEKPLIDDKVRAFAEYLGCDRQLAQDIYFDSKHTTEGQRQTCIAQPFKSLLHVNKKTNF